MGILSSVLRGWGWERKQNPTDRSTFAMIPPGTAVWTPKNYASLAQAGYVENAAVFACVSQIAKTASRINWVLTDKAGDEVEGHPLMKLLGRPNTAESGIRLTEKIFSFLLLSGNAYLTAVRGVESMPPAFLYAVRSDRVKIIAGTWAEPVRGYEYNAGSVPVTIPAGEVLHLTEFHPLNDLYGLSRIEVAARQVDVSNQAMEWNKTIFQNFMTPAGVFNFKEPLQDEQRDRFRKEMEHRSAGVANAGRFLVTEGEATWTQLSMTAKDMDYLNGQKFTLRQICAIFGVPPELLGDSEAKTYANYQEARKAFYEETVLPLMDIYAAELNAWLVPMYDPGLELSYDRDSIEALQEDRAQKWLSISQASWLTVNEKRAATGYDEITMGDVILVPMSEIPLEAAAEGGGGGGGGGGAGQEGAEDGAGTSQEGSEEDDEGEEEGEVRKARRASPEHICKHEHKRAGRGSVRMIPAFTKSFWTEGGRRAILWKAFEQRARSRERSFLTLDREYMAGQRDRVTAKLREFKAVPAVEARAIFNVKAEAEIYQNKFRGWYIDHAIRAGNAGLRATRGEVLDDGEIKRDLKASDKPAGWTFHLTPAQEEALMQMMFNSGTKVNATTIDIIYEVIKTSKNDPNITIEHLTQQIWEQVDWMDPARARLWAETETTKIDNWGMVEGYRESKFVKMKGWNCMLLDTSRPEHVEADGLEVELDESFNIGGELLDAPGDPTGSAWNVCNCRCSTYPVVTPADERVDDFLPSVSPKPDPTAAPTPKPEPKPEPPKPPTEEEFLAKMEELVTAEEAKLWEQTFSDKNEHATAWDKNGDRIKSFDGGPHSVNIQGGTYGLRYKDGFFTHTHPGYGSGVHFTSAFSDGDLNAASWYNFREMRATGKYSTWVITRPATGWPNGMPEASSQANDQARVFANKKSDDHYKATGQFMPYEARTAVWVAELNRVMKEKLGGLGVTMREIKHGGRKEGVVTIEKKKTEDGKKPAGGPPLIDDRGLLAPDWDEEDRERERQKAGKKED